MHELILKFFLLYVHLFQMEVHAYQSMQFCHESNVDHIITSSLNDNYNKVYALF